MSPREDENPELVGVIDLKWAPSIAQAAKEGVASCARVPLLAFESPVWLMWADNGGDEGPEFLGVYATLDSAKATFPEADWKADREGWGNVPGATAETPMPLTGSWSARSRLDSDSGIGRYFSVDIEPETPR